MSEFYIIYLKNLDVDFISFFFVRKLDVNPHACLSKNHEIN